MPKTKIPTLGAVAAEQDDEKKKGRIGRALGVLAAAFGLDAPGAKMTKKTLTTKRVEMEESDESEEEESVASTARSSDETSSEMSDSRKTSSEFEEEEEEESGAASSAEEEEEAAAKGAKKMEEEEEAKIAKGWAAAEKAYAKVAGSVDAYGVRGPKGLRKAAEKATGTKGPAAAVSALYGLRAKAATADAKVLARQASIEQKVAKIETNSRRDRVNAIVKTAKAEARAGATTSEGRAMLREYGMAHGSKKLVAFIATQGKVARTTEDGERIPHLDAKGSPIGAPSAQQQVTEMAMADLSPEARAEYQKIREQVAGRKANGAAPKGGY